MPRYGVPRSEWPAILRRIEQGESLRGIAQDYTSPTKPSTASFKPGASKERRVNNDHLSPHMLPQSDYHRK